MIVNVVVFYMFVSSCIVTFVVMLIKEGTTTDKFDSSSIDYMLVTMLMLSVWILFVTATINPKTFDYPEDTYTCETTNGTVYCTYIGKE